MDRPDIGRRPATSQPVLKDADVQLRLGRSSSGEPGLGIRLVRNSVLNVGGHAVIVALILLATPYLIHQFGVNLYGSFILLLTYIEVFSWLDLGITSSLTKYLAELLPTRQLDEINRLVGTALAIVLLAGVAVAAGIGLWAHLIVMHGLNVPDELRQPVTVGLWIASLTFLVRFIGQVTATIPMAAERFDLVNAVAVGTEMFRIVGSVVVVYWGFLLEAVMVVTLLAAVANGLVNMMVARRVVPGLSWRPCFSPVHIRAMVGFSKYVVISNTSARVFHAADKILLGYFLPASSVAFYAVPYSLGQRLGNLAGNITSTVFPAVSALMARAGDGRLSELYLRGTKSVAACVCFPALAICLLSGEILTHWIDPDFARQATVPLQILSVGFLMNCLSYMPYVVIQARGQPEIAARFTSVNAGLSIALFLCLIPSFGTVGAAVGFLSSQVICIPWFIHRINGELGIKWLEFTRGLNSVFLTSGLGCLLLTILRPWIVSLWSLGVTISFALVAYAVLVALFVLDSKERATCLAVMDQALPFGLRRVGVRWVGHKP